MQILIYTIGGDTFSGGEYFELCNIDTGHN